MGGIAPEVLTLHSHYYHNIGDVTVYSEEFQVWDLEDRSVQYS